MAGFEWNEAIQEMFLDDTYKKKHDKPHECMHDMCQQCHGTGKKEDGAICIHYISCSCPKCTFTC